MRVYECFRKSPGRRWIFRGEARADRTLKPSLERTVEKYGLKEDPGDLEERLLREFQRKAHHYLATAVPPLDDSF